ncbi:MAG: 7-cyano-7-deazaguanine synthase QueC [Chitinivibrionales bacterium]|nr:7-cyano-7-deazaguanine synthase QueC [Chitinivibrionales bacterium]
MKSDVTGSVKKAVVLVSGGIDSATCAAIAKAEGFAVYALSFSYGQRHRTELVAAQAVASAVGAREHKIIPIDLRTFGASSLTDDLAVPKDRPIVAASDRITGRQPIPNTYVPARNTIFLSYSLAWAEVLASSDIYIGVTAVDYSGYPDCRPEYIQAFQAMANLATARAVSTEPVMIRTPLINLTKAQIIRTGISLGLDYAITQSCYDPLPQGGACGRCDSCQIRRKGFAEAGVTDPTVYESGTVDAL